MIKNRNNSFLYIQGEVDFFMSKIFNRITNCEITFYDHASKREISLHGKIDLETARVMIHDDKVKGDGTMQTVTFKPADGIIRVWSRNRALSDFVEFDVNELLGITPKLDAKGVFKE